jgi:hypothetical protein
MRHLLRQIRDIYDPYPGHLGPVQFRKVARVQRFSVGHTQFLGNKFYFPDSGSFLHSVEEIFMDEVYRYRPNGDKPYIIDAGANMGLSILYFKKLAPSAVNEAVWTENTELTFFSEGALSGSSELEARPNSPSRSVPAIRLRDLIEQRRVDFLKIDIEGAENSVIFDIENVLGNVNNLFLEYHSIPGREQLLGEMLSLVKRSGFRYYLSAALGPRHPFIDKPTGYDTQLNISCVRTS